MPELPEVETVRIGLAKLLPRKIISGVSSDTPKSFPNVLTDVEQFMVGARVATIRRRAKVLMIDLDSGYSLVIHLKMTGQMVFVASRQSPVTSQQHSSGHDKNSAEDRFGAGHPNDSLIGNLPDKSTRVTITFSDGSNYILTINVSLVGCD